MNQVTKHGRQGQGPNAHDDIACHGDEKGGKLPVFIPVLKCRTPISTIDRDTPGSNAHERMVGQRPAPVVVSDLPEGHWD